MVSQIAGDESAAQPAQYHTGNTNRRLPAKRKTKQITLQASCRWGGYRLPANSGPDCGALRM
jgi:hypothetical protein